MNIKFYSGFSKRLNSTKVPTGNPQLSLDGNLREGTSVISPIIGFKNLGAVSPTPYIYAYIEKFSRYYFISDWKYEEGIWYAYMSEDCLASWKTNIGNTSAYIERSASEYDGNVIDTLYPSDTNYTIVKTPLATAWNGVAPSGGCYVVGIISGDSSAPDSSMIGGSVTYYVMTPANLRSLIHYLYSGTFLNDNGFPQQTTITQQISFEVAKAFVNPSQYIVSCTWFPFSVSAFASGSNVNIQIGYYDVGNNYAVGKIMDSVFTTATITGVIPSHPLANTRGEYLNYTKHSRHSLLIEPFGSVPIDNDFLRIGRTIYGEVTIDPVSGKAMLRVKIAPPTGSSVPDCTIYETDAMFGIPIQLSQVTSDFLGASANLLKGGALIAQGLSGAVKESSSTAIVPYGSNQGIAMQTQSNKYGVGSGDYALMLSLPSIGNAINSISGKVQSTGVNGSYLMTSPTLEPMIISTFTNPVAENNTECGRPLCAIRTINTLTGYIKCGEVTIDYPCFDTEKSIIEKYLLNGFFWE